MPPTELPNPFVAALRRGSAAWRRGLMLILLAMACAGCDPVDADFFPMAEGNVWLYDWSKRRTPPVTEPLPAGAGPRMWSVTDPPDGVMRREAETDWTPMRSSAIALLHQAQNSTITFSGEYRPGGTVKVSKLNGVLTIQTQATGDLQRLNFNLPILAWPVHAGAKWEDYGPDYLAGRRVAMCRLVDFETVETPAGKFFECAHVVRLIDPGLDGVEARLYRVQHFWLAPEIGLVKILYENELGPELRGELRAFRLSEMSAADRQRQQQELDATLDPEHALKAAGDGEDHSRLTPEQMYEREQWLTRDSSHRR